MNNIFSLSFSDNSFQLVHSTSEGQEQKLVSCNQLRYSQPVSVDQIFNEGNLHSVIEAVTDLKDRNSLQDVDLLFSLPFNFAKIKKIAYPNDSDKKLKRSQIEWELESVISENIKSFKISVLKESKNQKNYSEALIVAISKALVKKLQYVAEESKTGISGVFINCLSIENYLENNNTLSSDQNHLFLKVGDKYIEQHFFLAKQYLTSYIDLMKEMHKRSREEIILELLTDRLKEAVSLASQMENNNKFRLIIYGNSVSDNVVGTLKKGLSLSVECAGIDNYSEQDGYKYIEAWGSTL